jgi:hypothetical protein
VKNISGTLRIECENNMDAVEWFGIIGGAVYKLRELGWSVDMVKLELVQPKGGEEPT